jgi:hypothetical protein
VYLGVGVGGRMGWVCVGVHVWVCACVWVCARACMKFPYTETGV